MQTVLSIDVSVEPAQALLFAIEGKEYKVLEKHTAFLGKSFSKSKYSSNEAKFETETTDDSTVPVPSTEASSEQQVTQNPSENQDADSSPLLKLISSFQTAWTNSILVVPPHDYLGLNIELPFNDNKNINRVLELEVQDIVPFEVSEFLISHKNTSPSNGDTTASNGITNNDEAKSHLYDIHVGLLPKNYIKQIIEECKRASFEPVIVTTPASLLGAFHQLAPQYFSPNSAVILENFASFLVACSVDGNIRTNRNITYPHLTQNRNGNENKNGTHSSQNISENNQQVLRELKLSLSSAEQKYEKNFEKVYFIGNSFETSELQQALGRNVETINLNEFMPIQEQADIIPSLAAVFGKDENTTLILENFRVREFAYRPQLKELVKGIKALTPYIVFLSITFTIYLLATYLTNAWQISRLSSAMREQIKTAIPSLHVEPGQELQAVQIESTALEEQLKDVSSLSTYTPLELFAEIAKDFPESSGLNISIIKIKDNKISVEGTAANRGDIEKNLRVLQKNPLFKQVKKSDGGNFAAPPGLIGFSFELWVKE